MARRVRGQGSVREKRGRFQARLQTSPGNRITAMLDTAEQAWDWIANEKTKRRAAPAPAAPLAPAAPPAPSTPAPAPSIRFDDLCRLYKVHKSKRWRPGTLAFFEAHADRGLIKHFGTRRIGDIKALDLQTYLDDMLGRPCMDREGNPTAKFVQAGTVTKYQQLLGQLFTYAVRMDFLPVSPMAKVERIHAEAKDQRVLRLHEIQAVLAAAPDDQRPFFSVLAMTGLRRAEIFRMRWDWVDFDGGRLRVKLAKRGSNELPLSPAVREILEALRAKFDALPAAQRKPDDQGRLPYVFPGRGGKLLTCKAQALNRIVNAAGLQGGVGLHSFRRGYLSLIERLPGVSYSIVKALARHSLRSSGDITARYLYPEPEELLAALTTLEQRILLPSNVVPLKAASAR